MHGLIYGLIHDGRGCVGWPLQSGPENIFSAAAHAC